MHILEDLAKATRDDMLQAAAAGHLRSRNYAAQHADHRGHPVPRLAIVRTMRRRRAARAY